MTSGQLQQLLDDLTTPEQIVYVDNQEIDALLVSYGKVCLFSNQAIAESENDYHDRNPGKLDSREGTGTAARINFGCHDRGAK